MPYAIEVDNPFEHRPSRKETLADGTTVRDYVDSRFGKGGEFAYPTICQLNGRAVMRADWGSTILRGNDVARFARQVEGEVALAIFYVLSAAYTIYAIATLETPSIKGQEEGDSVFSLSGQRNQTKLGAPIPVPYGLNRLWPDYAASSYTKFEGNDQILFQLFCLGPGSYAIDTPETNIQIEDTGIGNFQDVTHAIYDPGEEVTLFPDNVVTSAEVENVELFGPNEAEYTSYVGPFAANAAGTTTTTLEWDVVFPYGLYEVEGDGEIVSLTVTASFEYRAIDDAGAPVGAGTYTAVAFSKTLATNTPQRFTVATTVSAARYEVRARRTNNADTTTQAQDTLFWYQLRAILPSTKDYGDVTLLAVRAKASNNLNSNSSNRVNVWATRKLEIWNGSTWSAASATRSPVWAFADINRAAYGANLGNSKIGLADLIALDSVYASRGDTFDWVYDQKVTIWDALKLCARAGRAAPIVVGTKVSMVRDGPKSVPVAAFAPQNMVKGSFSWQLAMQPESGYDGIEVEYLDHATSRLETVDCLVGDDAGENTQKITIPGITDRDKAYREGLFVRAQQVFNREVVRFETGREGELPIFGDLCAVAHDAPDWSRTGFVSSIAVDNRTINLDTSLEGHTGNAIAFRDKTGAIDGPYLCSKVSGDPLQVVTAEDVTGAFLFNDSDEPPIFFFGEYGDQYRLCTLNEKTTDGESETTTMTLVGYEDRIHNYDDAIAPPLPNASTPASVPDLPTVASVSITAIPGNSLQVLASWTPALGAKYYAIENSYDGTTWSYVATTTATFFHLDYEPGLIYARVAGVNAGQGAWTTGSAIIGFDARVDSLGNTRVLSNGDTRIIV